MEVNMQASHFELSDPLSAAHLKTLHLNPQHRAGAVTASACQLRWPIRNRPSAISHQPSARGKL
jgi:hypothetical protein